MKRSRLGRFLPATLRVIWNNRLVPAAVHAPAGAPAGTGQAQDQRGRGRVLTLVSHELTPTGAPKLALQVARACIAGGWTVVVVSPEDGPYRDLFVRAGATVVVSPLTWGRSSPAQDLARCSDAVLCNTIVAALLVRHGVPAPLVWYVHETEYIATFDRPDLDLGVALGSARQLWAASPMVARHLAPFADHVEVMGGTVEPVAARPAAHDGPARLLVMGGVESRKGQLGLARAGALLSPAHRAALRITLHGRETDPAYAETVRLEAASLPFWRQGAALSPDAALEALAGADGVIIPSLDEPLSLVALEAMSAGKVVICTRACGIADFLTDGRDAFIGPDASAPSLAATLARALDARDRWPAMGEEARRRFNDRFSPQAFAARVRDRLDALADDALS